MCHKTHLTNQIWFTNTFQINSQAESISEQKIKHHQRAFQKLDVVKTMTETKMNKTHHCTGRFRTSILLECNFIFTI